ncbi:MAG TPA: hypothetical protein VGL46_06590 [Pseudonocardiaceae bacterium]|jgi:hypothetical protein
MHTGIRLTPGLLIEELGLDAGPAVWGYRDAVVAVADGLGVTVDHDLGLVQIGLHLAAAPGWVVGWRIDHGWYLVRQPRVDEPPAVGPTLYRTASNVMDQLMPVPADVARWLHEISNQRLVGTEQRPDNTLSAQECAAVLDRLRRYLPRHPTPGYSWSDDRPLTQAEHHVAG